MAGTAPRGPRGPGPRRSAVRDRAARRACGPCHAGPAVAASRAGPTTAASTSSGSSSPASPPARRSSPAPPPAAAAASRPARPVRRMWAASRSTYSDPIAGDVKSRGVNGYANAWRPSVRRLALSGGDRMTQQCTRGAGETRGCFPACGSCVLTEIKRIVRSCHQPVLHTSN